MFGFKNNTEKTIEAQAKTIAKQALEIEGQKKIIEGQRINIARLLTENSELQIAVERLKTDIQKGIREIVKVTEELNNGEEK